jgi:hypothetical protein
MWEPPIRVIFGTYPLPHNGLLISFMWEVPPGIEVEFLMLRDTNIYEVDCVTYRIKILTEN